MQSTTKEIVAQDARTALPFNVQILIHVLLDTNEPRLVAVTHVSQ